MWTGHGELTAILRMCIRQVRPKALHYEIISDFKFLSYDDKWKYINIYYLLLGLEVLLHVLNLVSDLPDSVFLYGEQQAYLPWMVPFPAFCNSPSFKTAELTIPWFESFNTAREV